ncbi:hypothetical protein [Desulfoferrobacter suflitae]|nr:hypothetical protein [Desulfoferrobacter suflitae]
MEEIYRQKEKEKREKEKSRDEKSLWLRLFCPERRCKIRDFTDLP